MTDEYREEQEMEAEAIAAIFGTMFEIKSSTPLHKWSLTLQPNLDDDLDCPDETTANHVSVQMNLTLPETYPDAQPEIDIEVVKGLAKEQRDILIDLATKEAENNVGMPAVFTIAEAVREWLVDNNVKGLEDESMYAQMMRRARDEEKLQAKNTQEYESQKQEDQMTEAEIQDLEVRKRRTEGTPCTEEHFLKWKAGYEEEMALKDEQDRANADDDDMRKKKKKGDGGKNKIGADGRSKKEEEAMEGRLTGFEYFSQKTGGLLNLDALEKAADEAAASGGDGVEDYDDDAVNIDDLDEDLFDDC